METEEKPTAAFVLSLIGGIFILMGGIIMTLVSFVIGGLGLFCGILVVVGAVMLYANPEKSTTWGVIILVFSIVSLFFGLGGFIVGMILGIIGGALGIAWKPSPPPAPVPTPITRVCPQCGRVLTEEAKFCPHCGKALE